MKLRTNPSACMVTCLMDAETQGQQSPQECGPSLRQLRHQSALHPGGQELSSGNSYSWVVGHHSRTFLDHPTLKVPKPGDCWLLPDPQPSSGADF